MREVQIDMTMERQVPHPYRVIKAGFSESAHYDHERHFLQRDRFEVCIRYDSTVSYAEDTIGGVRYKTSFPHVYIKPPDIPFSNRLDDVRNSIFFWYPKELYVNFKEQGILSDSYFVNFTFSAKLTDMFAEFVELLQHSMEYGVADRIDNLCFTILQDLMLQARLQNTPRPDVRNKLHQMASFIRIHCCSKIDFDAFATEYGFSRRTFYRLWKNEFNNTPAHFQLELIMQEAARMLRDTEDSLSRIADFLQMRDSVYFCKTFRKFHNCTPTEYRRKHKYDLRPIH